MGGDCFGLGSVVGGGGFPCLLLKLGAFQHKEHISNCAGTAAARGTHRHTGPSIHARSDMRGPENDDANVCMRIEARMLVLMQRVCAWVAGKMKRYNMRAAGSQINA